MSLEKSFSIGYDFEGIVIKRIPMLEKSLTKISLDTLKHIVKIHTKKKSRFSIFVLGRMAEEPKVSDYLTYLSKTNKYADIQQHGYSHTLFKYHSLKGHPISLETMDKEISDTNVLIEEITGEKPKGIRAPIGFYRGFQGEKERLKILRKNGLKFISSDLRGPNDQYPAPWKDASNRYRQPYFYKREGYAEILEIPTQGTIDVRMKGISKSNKTKSLTIEEELKYYISNIKFAFKNNLNYSTVFHPWAIAYNDKDLFILNNLLDYLVRKRIQTLSYIDIYKQSI